MADANMAQLKKENEEALRNLRSNMDRERASIQQRNNNLQSEISRLRAELNKPRPGMYVWYLGCHLVIYYVPIVANSIFRDISQ